MGALGERLYRVVEAYAAIGDHRTGTAVDGATRQWFGEELARRGAVVDEVPYGFARYVADGRLTVAGRDVPMLALWYAGVGEVNAVEPSVQPLSLIGGHLALGLGDAVAAGRASGAPAVVLATGGSDGRLVALNREPADPEGPLVVLAPGAELDALRAGPTVLTGTARIEPGTSATVTGWLGPPGDPPLVITTPLTGWFRCAGERGTGIAAALELAAVLSRRHPVLVVGTTGHELGHLGARHWLGGAGRPVPRAVLHLGASVAATDPSGDLSSLRLAMTTLGDGAAGSLGKDLAPAGLPVRDLGDPWPGEGEEWRHLGVPVLSLTGGFDRFHTPADLAPDVTSPAALEVVVEALVRASSHLL